MQSAPKGQRRTFFGCSLLKAQNKILSPFEQVQSNILHWKRVMEMPTFGERNIQFAAWFLYACLRCFLAYVEKYVNTQTGR